MLQIGLRAHDYGTKLTVEELARILDEYKPVSIQLALAKSFVDAPKPGGLNIGFARRVRKVLEERNIAIAVLGCYINPVHPDPETRDKQLKSFEEHLRFARDFGCAMVGTETGSCNPDCSYHPDTDKPANFDIFCRSLEKLVTTAEKSGSICAIEAVAHQHTISTIEKMQQVLTKFSSPALKVIYDPVNILPVDGLGGESQKDFFTRAFDTFGNDIVVIHAKDFRMENSVDHAGVKKNGTLPAGTGEMDYSALLRLIMERKPGIDILLENTSPGTGKIAAEYLRSKIT
jgi:sugar phosphate isomerase/epimerase